MPRENLEKRFGTSKQTDDLSQYPGSRPGRPYDDRSVNRAWGNDRLPESEWAKIYLNPRFWNEQSPRHFSPTGVSYDSPGVILNNVPEGEDPLTYVMGDWDYKNPPKDENGRSINMRGDILPTGAVGWRPDGEPHWDNWFDGFMYRAFNMGPKQMDAEEEAAYGKWKPSVGLWEQLGNIIQKEDRLTGESYVDTSPDAEGTVEKTNREAELFTENVGGFLGDMFRQVSGSVGSGYRKLAVEDGGEEQDRYTFWGRAGKVVGEVVWGGINLLGQPAEKIEQVWGAHAMTLKEMAGDKAVELGDINVAGVNFNWALESTLGVAWNGLMALGHEDKYDTYIDTYKRNWEAARIAYTIFGDETVKHEFIRRQQEGQDPRLLELELQNPWTELFPLMLLDPLNVIGGWWAKVRQVDRVTDATRTAGRAVSAYDDLLDGARIADLSGAQKTQHLQEFVTRQMQFARRQVDRLDEVAAEWGLFRGTTQAKRFVYGTHMAEATGWIVSKFSRDVDEGFEVMKALANLHSPDENIVADAMKIILNQDSPDVMLSDRFQIFGKLLHETLIDPTEGVVVADKFLEGLQAAKDTDDAVAAVMQHIEKTYQGTLDNFFPDMGERAAAVARKAEIDEAVAAGRQLDDVLEAGEDYQNISRAARLAPPPKAIERAARFDSIIKSNVFSKINNIYATMYMGLSPGYAVRNMLSNSLHVLIDEGPAAWGKGTLLKPSAWVEPTRKWLGGTVPKSMFAAIGKHTFAEGVGQAKKWQFAMNLANKFEMNASKRIVGKVVDDTMRRMLQRGKALPGHTDESYKALVRSGFTDDAISYLEDSIIYNFGDVDAAKADFLRHVNDNISVRYKDSLRWIPQDDLQKLGGDVMEIQRITREADTLDEALEGIRDWHERTFEDVADAASRDVPNIQPNTPEAEQVTHVSKAVESGDASSLTGLMANGRVVATQNAHNAWADLVMEAQRTINYGGMAGRGTADEVKQIVNQRFIDAELPPLFSVTTGQADPWLARYAQVTQDSQIFSRQVYELSEEITAKSKSLRNKPAEFRAYLNEVWEKIRQHPDDVMPSDWTSKQLKNYLWDTHFANEQNVRFATEIANEVGKMDGLNAVMDSLIGAENWSQKSHIATKVSFTAAAQSQAIAISRATYDKAEGFYHLRSILQGQLAREDWANAARTQAALHGITSATDAGKQFDLFIMNVYNKHRVGVVDEAADASRVAAQSSVDEATKALILAEQEESVARSAHQAAQQAYLDALNSGDNAADALEALTDATRAWEESVVYRTRLQGEADDAAEALRELGDTPTELAPINSLNDLTREQYEAFLQAFERRTFGSKHGEFYASMNAQEAVSAPFGRMAAPLAEGATPTHPHAIYQSLDGLRDRRDRLLAALEENWERSFDMPRNTDGLRALDEYAKIARGRVDEARAISRQVADAAREFTLLQYEKRAGIDLALAYIYPYSFWYTRTYKNWLTRVANNPQVIAAYSKYRSHLEQINAGAPEWWRYNVRVDNLFGVELDNPLFFNLEATLNPLNAMVGVDFNDPDKRVSWWTKTLDDLGKWGPTTWTPYQILTAMSLYMQGEKEAAAKWAGRAIPQTLPLRHIIHATTGEDVELDPFVHLFSGGIESYEKNRIGRALSTLVDGGFATEEQIIDAAQTKEGPVWDRAVDIALGQRDLGAMTSYFAGVGFKARTEGDMLVDIFYQEYRRLWAQNGNMSPDNFREAMDAMRVKYPFMDSLLISRKAGLEQDRAIAYNVLGRIPPGMSDDLAELVGIPQGLLSQFYEDKGNIQNWDKSDRESFMAGIAVIGATISMPSTATRQEWSEVRRQYNGMQEQGKELFGEDVWQQVELWYSASALPEEQRDGLRDALESAYPGIQQALDYRQASIANNPLLYDYYGGIDFYERYQKSLMYDKLYSMVGGEKHMTGLWEQYFAAKAEDEANLEALRDAGKSTRYYKKLASQVWNAHPEFELYIEERDKMLEAIGDEMERLGDYLIARGPETLEIRPDAPISGGYFQEQLTGQVNPQIIPWQQYEQMMSPYNVDLFLDYAIDGEELPAVTLNELTALAEGLGVSLGELVGMMQTSLNQELGTNQP